MTFIQQQFCAALVACLALIDFARAMPIARDTALQLSLYNTIAGSQPKAYITGMNLGGQLGFLSPQGAWWDPCVSRDDAGTQAVPVADITHELGAYQASYHVSIPSDIHSGRIYVTEDTLDFFTTDGGFLQEPSGLNLQLPNGNRSWSFAEFSFGDQNFFYVNPSVVDFVGIPLSMSHERTGGPALERSGLNFGARDAICDDLQATANQTGHPWGSLCLRRADDSVLRVFAPTHANSLGVTDFDTYWDQFACTMWNKFLTYNKNSSLGVVTPNFGTAQCTTMGLALVCSNGNLSESFSQPVTADVWGCASGPFANLGTPFRQELFPALCASFHRSTIGSGLPQPNENTSMWYQKAPSNFYAAMVHRHSADGMMYAFPYDDVQVDGEDISGSLSCQNATKLTIGVGGPLPSASSNATGVR